MSSLLSRAFLRMRCACSALARAAAAAALPSLCALPLALGLALPPAALSQEPDQLMKACNKFIDDMEQVWSRDYKYTSDNNDPWLERDPGFDYGPVKIFACGEGHCWRAELRSRKDPGAVCEIDTSRPVGEEARRLSR